KLLATEFILTRICPSSSASLLWFNFFEYNPLLRLPEFMVGIACGIAYSNSVYTVRPKFTKLLTAISGVGCILVLAWSQQVKNTALITAFAPFAFGLLIYLLARSDRNQIILRSKLIVALGEASYAIYILHAPLAGYLHKLSGQATFGPSMLFIYLIVVISAS